MLSNTYPIVRNFTGYPLYLLPKEVSIDGYPQNPVYPFTNTSSTNSQRLIYLPTEGHARIAREISNDTCIILQEYESIPVLLTKKMYVIGLPTPEPNTFFVVNEEVFLLEKDNRNDLYCCI